MIKEISQEIKCPLCFKINSYSREDIKFEKNIRQGYFICKSCDCKFCASMHHH